MTTAIVPAEKRVETPRGKRWLSLNWESFPDQQGCFGDDGVDILVTGVGGGKSIVAAAKIVMWALNHPRGRNGRPTVWGVVGPDFDLVREIQLELVLDHLRQLRLAGPKPPGCECVFSYDERIVCTLCAVPYEAVVKRAVGGNKPAIELWNGVTIKGFSGTHPKRMRGHALSGLWIDEAEFQTEESLTIGQSRQRSAKKIRTVITSSPDGAGNGWLWRVISGDYPEWDKLRTKTKVRVHRWGTLVNKANDREVIEAIGATIEATTPGGSRQELDGLFIGTDEAPGSGVVDWPKAFVGKIGGLRPRAVSIGVDLAKSDDFSWLTGASADGTVTAMDRFNLSTVDVSESDFWPFARKRLLIFASDYATPNATLVIDTARGGDQFAAAIRGDVAQLRLQLHVVECPTDSVGKKSEICEALGMAVSLGRYRVPTAFVHDQVVQVDHVDTLRLEMKKLVVTDVGSGKRRWTHPKGGHDDGVVSSALAWRGLSRNTGAPAGPLTGWKAPDGGKRWFS